MLTKLHNNFVDTANPYSQGLQLSYLPRILTDTNSYGLLGLNQLVSTNGAVIWYNRHGRDCWKVDDAYYATPTISTNLAAGDLTVRIIIEVLSFRSASNNVLLYKGASSLTRELYISLDNTGGTSTIALGRTNSTPALALGIELNQIYDIVVRRIGTTVTIFVNGVNKGTFSNSGVLNQSATLLLGRSSEAGFVNLDGYIYGCEIWTRGLADSDIQDLTNKFFNNNKSRRQSWFVYPQDIIQEIIVFTGNITCANVYNRSFISQIEFVSEFIQGKELNINFNDYLSLGDKVARQRVFNITLETKFLLNNDSGHKHAETADNTIDFTQVAIPAYNLSGNILLSHDIEYLLGRVANSEIIFSHEVTFIMTKIIIVNHTLSFTGAGVGFFQTVNNEWTSFSYGGDVD